MEELAMDKQQTQHLLKDVAHKNSHTTYNLSAQMIELAVVQGAVGRLLEKLDEIKFKGWDNDPGMAYLSLGEIRDSVRLIDMAFRPLFQEISEDVNTVEKHAETLFNAVVKSDSEQSSEGVTQVTNSQIVSAQKQKGVSY